MTRPNPRNVCNGCRQSFDRRLRSHVELGPVLHDHVWQQVAHDPRERLCFVCMDLRAAFLGRVLRLVDLRPCRWNLEGHPSFFDVFVQREGGVPPTNLDEWRSVGEPGEFAPLDFPRVPA